MNRWHLLGLAVIALVIAIAGVIAWLTDWESILRDDEERNE